MAKKQACYLTKSLGSAEYDRYLPLVSDNSLLEFPRSTPKVSVKLRNVSQKNYIEDIDKNDITFGVGPAGTGKTFLAVYSAVKALEAKAIERIILVRPIIDAGESLGYLPGDIGQKVDPYMRPLYDALHDLMKSDTVPNLIKSGVVEILPLAYMRGRTLNNAFIILDEAQNTTPAQMRMFLTRLGDNSKMVITGDPSQKDLPKHQVSGLEEAVLLFKAVPNIAIHNFCSYDIVRHKLVQKIVEIYERNGNA